MFLQRAFQKTFQAVRRHKLLFLALLIFQIIFIVLLAFINIKYQVAIVENLKTVTLTLESANYNETLIQMGQPFLENPYEIYQSYNAIWSNLKYLLGFTFLIFLIFEGFNWALSLYMLKKQNFFILFSKFIATALIYLVPTALIIYLILKTSWEANLAVAVDFSMAIFIVMAYFMAISLSLLENKIKNIFKITFKIGIKKIDYVLFTLIISLIILGLFGALMYTSIVWPFLIMMALMIVFVLVLIIVRIFFIAAILEIP